MHAAALLSQAVAGLCLRASNSCCARRCVDARRAHWDARPTHCTTRVAPQNATQWLWARRTRPCAMHADSRGKQVRPQPLPMVTGDLASQPSTSRLRTSHGDTRPFCATKLCRPRPSAAICALSQAAVALCPKARCLYEVVKHTTSPGWRLLAAQHLPRAHMSRKKCALRAAECQNSNRFGPL